MFEELDKENILLECIDDNLLNDLINGEKSQEKMVYYLKWKYDRINKNLSEKQDFSLKDILISKECTPHMKRLILKWGLLIQNTNEQYISCIKFFNEELKKLRLCEKEKCVDMEDLLSIAETILLVKQERNQDILIYVDKENLKTLLFELTNLRLNSEHHINVTILFLSYFEEIFINDPSIVDTLLFYLIEQENLDFLLILFNKKLGLLAGSSCFQMNSLWNLLGKFLSYDDSIRKKQALHILSLVIEYLNNNTSTLIPEVLKTKSAEEWNLYFILLHLSKEKQLHLIKPTLKLLESITSLHISWRSCLYKILLNHSQLFVVYKTVEHLVGLLINKIDDLHYILRNVIGALNKYEYSDLSVDAYSKFESFCNSLDSKYRIVLFEEFISLEWNPAAAWSFLNSASSVLNKVPQKYILKILQTLKYLPHTFIRNSCIYLFLQRLLEKREGDILGDLLLIGQFLLFGDSYINEKLFRKVVEKNKTTITEKKILLLENIIDSINSNNEKNLYIYLELMKILEIPLDSNINIQNSAVGDIILLHFPNLKDTEDMLQFLLFRFEYADEDDEFQYLSKYLDNLFLKQSGSSEMIIYGEEYNEKLERLWNISKYNNSKILIAMKLIAKSYYFETVMQMIKIERQNCFANLAILSHKSWIERTFKCRSNSSKNENFTSLMEKLKELLDMEREEALFLVIESLELLLNCCTNNEKVLELLVIYENCLKQICKLPNAALRFYSVIFFNNIFHLKLFSSAEFVECWKRWVDEYFEEAFFEVEFIMKVILQGCRKIILLEAPNVEILLPLILQGLLCGTIVQKNQRVEYGICHEIYRTNKRFLAHENPNIISAELKMLSMESLYLLVKHPHANASGLIVPMLLNIYKKYYKSRYFPDSKIHFEKLRIVQALLLVGPCSTDSQGQIVSFILNSFYEETHQPSVKRLLQWLLIVLLLLDPLKHLEVIIEKVNTSSLSHPSFLIALIPVLYHVVINLEYPKFWFQVSQILLPWTMGANFKLRVYSQVTMKMLLEKANERKFMEYVANYSFLENSLLNVLIASGEAVENTLKNDLSFIQSFDHKLYYSIENIFINFPKMLDVPPSEWENILDYEFSDRMDIKIKTDQDVQNISKIVKNTNEKLDFLSGGINIQTKITPWKSVMEENIDNKTLGNIVCVASLLEKAANLGGLSRTCEIFSVKQLVLHNWKIKDDKEFKHLSMSSENWVNIIEVKRDNLSEFLMEMKQQGYSLIGLEQTSESKKLNEFKFPEKTVLLLGNEKEGIPAPLLPLMNTCVEIPQYGQTRSLNVHVAGAIFIWEYVRQHNEKIEMT